MTKQIERQICDLEKELDEFQDLHAVLYLQPCNGDTTIRQKEEKLEELEQRIRSLKGSIRELERKRQEMISEPLMRGGYESPFI